MALHDPAVDKDEQPLTLEFVASNLLELREQFTRLQDVVICMQRREMKWIGVDPVIIAALEKIT